MRDTGDQKSIEKQKPRWLKTPLPKGSAFHSMEKDLRSKNLFTVCEEAKCPNRAECWSAKTATVMILGDTCTRACKFCHVKTGNPKGFLDQNEPENTAEIVSTMELNYVVITSVDRDDLADGGALHFARTVEAIRKRNPKTNIEVLIPDFDKKEDAMKTLALSNPLVIAQNLETVERLTYPVRDRRAGYQKTLDALVFYKIHFPHIFTKSSLMVGLGETKDELESAMKDLRKAKVDILTIGQYLQPSPRHLKVQKYYHPEEFENLKKLAESLGFIFVASGPMVRSSYKAGEFLNFIENQKLQQVQFDALK